LANIAFQAGETFDYEDAKQVTDGVWSGLLGEMDKHLSNHKVKIESAEIKLSPMLEVDVEKEVFVGTNSREANKFLKREYRKGYEVPELV